MVTWGLISTYFKYFPLVWVADFFHGYAGSPARRDVHRDAAISQSHRASHGSFSSPQVGWKRRSPLKSLASFMHSWMIELGIWWPPQNTARVILCVEKNINQGGKITLKNAQSCSYILSAVSPQSSPTLLDLQGKCHWSFNFLFYNS